MGTDALDKFLARSLADPDAWETAIQQAIAGPPPRTQAVTLRNTGAGIVKTKTVRTLLHDGTGLSLPTIRTETLDENDNPTGEYTVQDGPAQVDKRMLFDQEFRAGWHPWAPGGWGAIGTQKVKVKTVVVKGEEYQVLEALFDKTNQELTSLKGGDWKPTSRAVYKGEKYIGQVETAAFVALRGEYERAQAGERLVPNWIPPEGSEGKPPEPKPKTLKAKPEKVAKPKPEPTALVADEGFLAVVREDLLAALTLACKCVSRKAHLPVLANVHLYQDEGLGLYATDLEMGIVQRIAAVGSLAGITVPAHNLKAIVQKAPKKVVLQLQADDTNTLHIRIGDLTAKLRGLPEEEFPTPIPVDEVASYYVDGAALVKQVGRVVHACSTDETRPILTGFLIKPEAEKLVFIGTNTHLLAKAELPCDTGRDDPVNIVPARVAALWGKVAAGLVTLTFGKTHNFLAVGDTVITCRNIEGQFPNHEKITPEENGAVIRVRREALESVLGQLHVVAAEDAARIRFDCNGQTLTVSADAQDTGTAGIELPCEASGPFLWAQNGHYLKDVIAACGGEFVEFANFTGTLRPGVWRNPDDLSFSEVVMPMQTEVSDDLLGETCALCGSPITYQDAKHRAAVQEHTKTYHTFCAEETKATRQERERARKAAVPCEFCGVPLGREGESPVTLAGGMRVHAACQLWFLTVRCPDLTNGEGIWAAGSLAAARTKPAPRTDCPRCLRPLSVSNRVHNYQGERLCADCYDAEIAADEDLGGFGTCGFCGAPFGKEEMAYCTANGMTVHVACLPAASRNEGTECDDWVGDTADDLAKDLAAEYRKEKALADEPPESVARQVATAESHNVPSAYDTTLVALSVAWDDLQSEGYLPKPEEFAEWVPEGRKAEEVMWMARTVYDEAVLWYYTRIRAAMGITPAAEESGDLFAEGDDAPEAAGCCTIYMQGPPGVILKQDIPAESQAQAEDAPLGGSLLPDYYCAKCEKPGMYPAKADEDGNAVCNGCYTGRMYGEEAA